MEVVLSPGRFGDEVPGAPFQNEEIREWSHVDRLTGMLERARVETGRWKTLNQGAARSYGKVIDSRERNSADGSIVQRARRQVEVFQSEAPGRSVQVVRASQWSSSRVTDSSTTSPLAITSLAQKKNSIATPERLVASSSINKLSPSLLLSRDEAISERLSTLLGSFAHHISSSTVPLRRLDSKYATRTPISRRSTSNEDLVGHSEINSVDLLGDKESSTESHSPSYQKIKEKSRTPRHIEDCLTNSDEETRHKVHEINVDREETRDYNERLKIHEITVEREVSRDYQERLGESEDSTTSENSQNAIAVDEVRPTTNKAAIQLLPSSKANTTVVNLINDSNNSKAEAMDIREGKRSNILSWVSPSSVVGEEATRTDAEETKTTSTMTTTTTTSTVATTTSASPRREPRIDESVIPFSPGRSVKRVGFCKTEIHFAADSGKVNIVETDEKPPPTNKFRRRKRNSLNGLSSNKNLAIEKLPIVDTKDSLEQRSGENSKTKTDPNLHRGHTTSVNLGSDLSTKNEQNNRGFTEGRQNSRLSDAERHQEANFPGTIEASSQGILLRFENRIYDRLESYSSDLLLHSDDIPKTSSTLGTINIHQSALKSARLVMNLSRVTGSGCVSKILIANDVIEPHLPGEDKTMSDGFIPVEAHVDSAEKMQEDSSDYRDWRADQEVQCIMLGSSYLENNRSNHDNQALKLSSSSTTAKEPENIHENSDAPRIDHGLPTESTLKPIEKENNCLAHSALTAIESEHVPRKDVCNVVCTDADNNQVLLKVVTTHEPTIARVEIDHLRNSVKNSINLPAAVKKEKSVKKSPSSATKKLQKEHTYVNVFTGSKRTPIYENYKVIDPNPKIIAENKIEAPLTTDINSVIEKSAHVNDAKIKASQSNSSSGSKSKEIVNNKLERVKETPVSSVDGKLSKDTELNKSLVGNKKARNKTKESKFTRTEGANINNHSINSSREKSIKEGSKNLTARSSASSGEREEFVGGNNTHAGVKNSIASKSTRDATSAKRTSKGDALTKQKPIEVVYQTAVYNMKNEKLKKPHKGKESKGPRYLNELICGAKMKRPSDSKTTKTSSAAQNGANNKSALQPIKHWK